MSGGHYDYIYSRIEDIKIENTEKDPRRASFQKLLNLISKAMHDIEWVDSGDCAPGDEYEAIDKVFSFLGSDPEMITKANAFDALKQQLILFLEIKSHDV